MYNRLFFLTIMTNYAVQITLFFFRTTRRFNKKKSFTSKWSASLTRRENVTSRPVRKSLTHEHENEKSEKSNLWRLFSKNMSISLNFHAIFKRRWICWKKKKRFYFKMKSNTISARPEPQWNESRKYVKRWNDNFHHQKNIDYVQKIQDKNH